MFHEPQLASITLQNYSIPPTDFCRKGITTLKSVAENHRPLDTQSQLKSTGMVMSCPEHPLQND